MVKNTKKKVKKTVVVGIAHIKATFNNTIVTITDVRGNVLITMSAGNIGYKGSKKSTPYAAQIVAEKVAKKAMQQFGMKTVTIHLNGPGAGRESAIRSLSVSGLSITLIKDVTSVPHNGCRAPKVRRV